ncbi:MAG: hypothetical protein KA586_10765 [Candidatus Promineofilum sp.]|nr:hypothetical protein [Promineifilum sp.]
MNVWLRRFLILLFILFWLALILTPTLAFVLARNGQVQLGPSGGSHWRLFMLQQADVEGLGLERSRPVAPPAGASESVQCLQTTIDYWMWYGEGQGTSYCQCLDTLTGMVVDSTPPACLLP